MSSFPELTSGSRPVAIVSFAQYDNVRREDARNEVEMLMPVVAEVFGNIGITKDDVGFICLRPPTLSDDNQRSAYAVIVRTSVR